MKGGKRHLRLLVRMNSLKHAVFIHTITKIKRTFEDSSISIMKIQSKNSPQEEKILDSLLQGYQIC